MDPNDTRLHAARGWEAFLFPARCPECGDAAQSRGAYVVIQLGGP